MKAVKEIKLKDVFNESKQKLAKDYIQSESKKQTKKRQIRNELLSIQFKIEDYIERDNNHEESLRLLDFVKMYLETLNITKKDFAKYIDMHDSNLHKYLTGERKLNPKVVLKISKFTHTEPELWYRIQIKNEIAELKKEERETNEYDKYDYSKVLDF